MRKKAVLLCSISVIIFLGGYLYFRYSVLHTASIKPDSSSSKSIMDLRPALTAKLKQLVKDGSGGLYNLSVGEIEPDVLKSTVDLVDVALIADTIVLNNMERQMTVPDDVFKISFDKVHVEGIGLSDLVSLKKIDLKAVVIVNPVIELFHKERPYNIAKRQGNDSLTLYQKITKLLSSLAINNLSIKKATIINHDLDKRKITRYNDVSVAIKDLLIDSSTQYDKSRFLFARQAELTVKNYLFRTSDSLYFFTCDLLHVSAASHALKITGVQLVPRENKAKFEKKVRFKQDMYQLKIPEITLSGIDWWNFANHTKLIAKEANIYGCSFMDYLDRTLPSKPSKRIAFPHQVVMDIQLPVAINKVYIHKANIVYEEYNPVSAQSGKVNFSDLEGTLTNVTNMPLKIKSLTILSFKATSLFMHKVPVSVELDFDLARAKTGAFSAQVHAGAMDTAILNPIAEPLGLLSIKKGSIQDVFAKMKGDSKSVAGSVRLLYKNLYILPLKKLAGKGELNKKKFTAFIANLLLIKNANPDKSGKVRTYEYTVENTSNTNFFNLLWKTILAGVIKTIGAPAKLAK